jgi:hypothetical protein
MDHFKGRGDKAGFASRKMVMLDLTKLIGSIQIIRTWQ